MRRTRLGGLVLVVLLLSSCSGAMVRQARADRATTLPPISAVTTTPALPPPLTTTQSPGLQVDDLSWVSATHGWALTSTCATAGCTAVLTTSDGGTTWSPVGSITASAGACDDGCDASEPQVTHIRFANDLDGYAYDPDLYMTTDGGTSWRPVAGPMVAALEPAGGNVIRVAYTHAGCPGPCDLTVEVAPAGSTAWQVLKGAFPADSVQLVRQGVNDVYLAGFANPAGGSDDAHATLWLSHDGGTTWSARSDPCGEVNGDEYDTSALAAAPSSVVTALCLDRAGRHAFVAVSVDGGADFARQPMMSGPDLFASLAVTSASSIFLSGYTAGPAAPPRFLLLASSDGGRHWAQVASEPGSLSDRYPLPGFLGFENALVGRWVGSANELWGTTDGGLHWVSRPIQP